MSNIFYRATKYMNAEDMLLAREKKPKKRDKQEEAQRDKGRKTTRIGDHKRIGAPNPQLGGLQASSR